MSVRRASPAPRPWGPLACLFLLFGAEPVQERGAGEAPVVADLAAGDRALLCHSDHSSHVAAEQVSGLLGGEDFLRRVREELVPADGQVILHELGDEVLLGRAQFNGGTGELVSGLFWESYVERAHILISR